MRSSRSERRSDFAVLTAWSPVPEQWTLQQAAAAGLAAATAASAIQELGDIRGSTLLIEGASGAVGTAVAAFALAAGATVIGTGRESSHAALQALGVVPTTYGDDLSTRVAALAPDGVDFAVHSAPSDSLGELVAIVGNAARVVTVVDHQGAARFGTLQAHARNESSLLREGADLAATGRWMPKVDHEFALDDIIDAHAAAERGGGKIVVTVS